MKGQVIFFILSLFSFNGSSQSLIENCSNGLDDDGDGLVDLNDPECICKGIKDTIFIPSSLIPNPSFEEYNCCPSGLAQLFCSKNWIQASSATSDYFHTCGFSQDPMRGSPPKPLPAGNGYVGFLDLRQRVGTNTTYKEYVGACLTNTMQAGKDYTLSFWIGFGLRGNTFGPRAVTTLGIFGTSACSNLPFGGNNGWLCPTAYPNWFLLTQVTASGTNKWVKVTVKLRPTRSVDAIVVGPNCTRADGQYYFFIDDLILEESSKFDSIYLTVQGNPCIDSVQLSSPPTKITRIKYQWYFNGIAIPGATNAFFQIPKGQEGNYILKAIDGSDCELSNVYNYKIDTLSSRITQQICSGEIFKIGNYEFKTTGNYRVVLPSVYGCDSIVYLDLKVNTPGQGIIDTTICENDEIDIDGVTYDSSGVYQIVNQTAEGCDSFSTLKLTVLKSIKKEMDIFICEGESYIIEQDTLMNSGDFQYMYLSSFGCDSLVTIHLFVNKNILNIIDTAICNGQSIISGGMVYDKSGTYPFNLNTTSGCDSSVILNLRVKPSYLKIIDTAFCDGEVLKIGSTIFDKTGNYTHALTSVENCDSNFQIKLQVYPVQQVQLDTSLCEGEKLLINGQSFDQTGTYTIKYTNQTACDSMLKINLKVNLKSSTDIFSSFCEKSSIRIGSVDYNLPGNYIQTYKNQYTCDSIVSIHLTQNNVYQSVIDTSVCSGNYILFNNSILSKSGTYRADLKTINGCDSTTVLNLNVKPNSSKSIDTVICFNRFIDIGGIKIERDTLFQNQFISANGCDSIITVTVKKSTYPLVVVDKKDVLCAGDTNGSIRIKVIGSESPYSYKWNDGNSNPIKNQLSTGNYIVTITDKLNCAIEESVFINSPQPLLLDVISSNANCIEPGFGKILINYLQGGVKPYQLFIDGRNKILNFNIENVPVGNHTITVKDSNGCEINRNLFIGEPVRGSTELNPDSVSVILGDSVILEVLIQNIDSIAEIKWKGPGIILCDTCLKTTAFITSKAGKFIVIITDANGCVYEESVIVQSKQIYNVPNVFSPNGDNINDYFNLFSDRSIEVIDVLRIFDRWGNQLFESKHFPPNGIEGAWDGKVNDQKAMPGVYVYLFLFRDKTGASFKLTGNLTLIR